MRSQDSFLLFGTEGTVSHLVQRRTGGRRDQTIMEQLMAYAIFNETSQRSQYLMWDKTQFLCKQEHFKLSRMPWPCCWRMCSQN